jgi:hypothetical protein
VGRSNTTARRRERTSHPLSTKSSRMHECTHAKLECVREHGFVNKNHDERHAVAPQSSTPTHASQSVRLFAIAWTHVVVMERHGVEVAHPKSVALRQWRTWDADACVHWVIPTVHVLTSSHLQSGVVQSGHSFWHSVLVGSDCADAMARRPARTMAVNVMLVLWCG